MTEAAELNEKNNVQRPNPTPLRVMRTNKYAAVTCYATLCLNPTTAAPVIRPLVSKKREAGEAYINARPHNKVYKCLSTQRVPGSDARHT